LQKKDITLELSLQDNLPELYGFADQFQQVLINLITNSVDAMEGKAGPVLITTSAQGKDIILAVSDKGCGIPDTNLTRIFDPFFTTKEFGKGTGLGLTVTSNIVRAHGGSIDVRTKIDQGTMVSIRLPLES
jgi:two-component system NtrC family sensor kinase